MNFNNRADRKLNDLVTSGVLSGPGATWLKVALNPFYDTEDKIVLGNTTVSYEGMPNLNSDPSVNRTIRQQISISKPATYAADAVWDFMIVVWPVLNSVLWETVGRSNNVVNARNGDFFSRALLCVYTKLASDPNFTYNEPYKVIAVDPSYLTGIFSLNYGGFELVNTTPELYKGGSLSCCRYSQCSREPQTWMIAPVVATYANTFTTVQQIRAPPINLDELNTFPNAQTWSANDGAYVTYVMNSLADMPQMASYTQPSVNFHTFDDTPSNLTWPTSLNTTFQTMPNVQPTTNPIFPAYVPCMANVDIDTNVVMVTGQQPGATFTLTQKIGLESFPTTAEIDILPLAHPSPSWDACAIALYSESVRDLPPGCPVSMNPSGEWWDMAMNSVVGAAKGLGEMFFPEFTPLIQAGGKAYEAYRRSNTAAKAIKPKPKPQVNRAIQSKAQIDHAWNQAHLPLSERTNAPFKAKGQQKKKKKAPPRKPAQQKRR